MLFEWILPKQKLFFGGGEKGKSKAELDKAMEFGRRGDDYDTARQRIARLELENERLRQDLELAQAKTTRFGSNIYSSTHELDRIHDRADKTSSDLRRCQAELRVTQADSERARSEAQALQEKLEKSQVRKSFATTWQRVTRLLLF